MSGFESDNRKALEELKINGGLFNEAIKEHIDKKMTRYIKNIGEITKDTTIGMGIIYNNTEGITSGGIDIISYRIIGSDNDIIGSVEVKNKKTEADSLTDIEYAIMKMKEKMKELGIEPMDHFSELGYVKENAIYDEEYIFVWGIHQNAANDSSAIVKKWFFYLLDGIVDNMDVFVKINTGESDIDSIIKDNKHKFGYFDKYIDTVFEAYGLCDEINGSEEKYGQEGECAKYKKVCQDISFLPYETRECKGKAVFVDRDKFWADTKNIIFDCTDSMKFKDEKITRKMLESASVESVCLAVDMENDHELLGFTIDDADDQNKYIIFEGNGKYKFKIGSQTVLLYERGEYFVSEEERNAENTNLAEKHNIKGLEIFKNNVNEINHGATIIFFIDSCEEESNDAEEEAERLCRKFGRGYYINGLDMNTMDDNNVKFILGMCAVDGAVLVDKSGKCVAYGVILDGEAKVKGDPKRGARYNSAKNYIHGKRRAALVVSEDKKNGPEILYGTGAEVVQNKEQLSS